MSMDIVHAWRRLSMVPGLRPFTEARVYARWRRAGAPVPPPPIVKQRIVKQALRRHGLDTVVETGTFTGDMVHALRGLARHIVSIELDDRLYAAAARRFGAARGVELRHGDSSALFPDIARRFQAPVLFWLDAHYTGAGTAFGDKASPIEQEIDVLLGLRVRGHVVLIDDARLFVGADGYPTLAALRARIAAVQPRARVTVENDIITWITEPEES